VKLRRTKQDKAPSAPRSRATAARGKAASPKQARPQTSPFNNTAADGLPGKAGYPDGPNTSLPNFFHTRRPDGREDTLPRRRSKGFSPR